MDIGASKALMNCNKFFSPHTAEINMYKKLKNESIFLKVDLILDRESFILGLKMTSPAVDRSFTDMVRNQKSDKAL